MNAASANISGNIAAANLNAASNIFVGPLGTRGVSYPMFTLNQGTTNGYVTTNIVTLVSLISNVSGTVTFPAGFWQSGMRFTFEAIGQLTTTATPGTYTNAIKLGSTVIGTNTFTLPASMVNNYARWRVNIWCITNGAAGQFMCDGVLEDPASVASGAMNSRWITFVQGIAVPVDTTPALAFDMTWHTATAANSILIRSGGGTITP